MLRGEECWGLIWRLATTSLGQEVAGSIQDVIEQRGECHKLMWAGLGV